jgi:hypothetical protein
MVAVLHWLKRRQLMQARRGDRHSLTIPKKGRERALPLMIFGLKS